MSSSLLQRFQASRESAPVESPLDKPASIHDDAGKVVAAVEPAVPATSNSKSGPGLHAAGLPAEPVTKAVDAKGVAKDECADGDVVAAVKPAKPSTALKSGGLPAEGVKPPVDKSAARADEHADDASDTAAAVRSVTPHHTTEDLDPEAAQVEPATCIVPTPDHARETEDAYRALEEATLHTAMEEFSGVQANLMQLRGRIDSANQQGGLSAESAYFASFAVESFLKRFDLVDEKTTASFESAVVAVDGKTVINLESLDATLEGVDAPIKTFGKRFLATVSRLLVPTYTALKVTAGGLVKLAEAADKVKSTSNATIRVSGRSVAVGDAISKDVAGDLAKAAIWLDFLVGKFDKQAKLDFKHNRELVNKVFEETDEVSKIAPAMKEALAGWADPRKKLGGKASSPIIGNYVFFKDQSLKYKGDDPTAKAFDKLANEDYPEVIGFQRGEGRVSGGGVEINALTPKEVASLARQFERAVQGASLGKSAWETTKAAGTVAAMALPATVVLPGWTAFLALLPIYATKIDHRANQLHEKPGEGYLAEDLRTVYDALVTSQRLTFHVGYDAMRVLRKEIKLFKKLAKESLNAHARAAVEAFDQQSSVDGESVNETSPIEPRQEPSKGSTAPKGALMAKQTSWEDKPASFQTVEEESCEAIDFDGAASACESLIDEANEISVLSRHYATEDAASGEAKERPGMVERIKAWIAKIGEFFRGVWKRIVAFVTQQGNRLADWAKKVKQHHFDKKTVKITGSMDAHINDMKLPSLTPFFDFMDEAASAGEDVAKKLEQHQAHPHGMQHAVTAGHAITANADFMNLHTETAIPAEGMVGAFKLFVENGKLVETQVAKKVGPDREYVVTGSSLASFVDGAAKLIKKAEARVKAFEMKSDADWKRAKRAIDDMAFDNSGLFNLKPYGETARYLMKAFSVLQSWARAVGNFADLCIKGAGTKLHKNEHDDIVDAEFSPASEHYNFTHNTKESGMRDNNLPYWYQPTVNGGEAVGSTEAASDMLLASFEELSPRARALIKGYGFGHQTMSAWWRSKAVRLANKISDLEEEIDLLKKAKASAGEAEVSNESFTFALEAHMSQAEAKEYKAKFGSATKAYWTKDGKLSFPSYKRLHDWQEKAQTDIDEKSKRVDELKAELKALKAEAASHESIDSASQEDFKSKAAAAVGGVFATGALNVKVENRKKELEALRAKIRELKEAISHAGKYKAARESYNGEWTEALEGAFWEGVKAPMRNKEGKVTVGHYLTSGLRAVGVAGKMGDEIKKLDGEIAEAKAELKRLEAEHSHKLAAAREEFAPVTDIAGLESYLLDL